VRHGIHRTLRDRLKSAVLFGIARQKPQHGDKIRLSSEAGTMEGTVIVAPKSPRNLQVHLPEGSGRIDSTGGVPNCNAIVPVERL